KPSYSNSVARTKVIRIQTLRGFQPEGGVCLPGGPEVMLSVVSMKEVCRCVAVKDVEVTPPPPDMSRYVFDFTYCPSLNLRYGHAALIHVPPLSHWLPASLLGKALQVIIQEMLEESEVQTQKCNSRREAAGGASFR
ncbi:Pyroglutamyl-peptidase 1-like protein, partial [Lemmus lemmus]